VSFEAIFADLATGFSETFGGPYHEAQVVRQSAPTYDSGGSIVTPGATLREDCRAQGDAATEAMRAAEGFLATDIRLLVIGATALDTSAKVELLAGPHIGTWALLSVQRDPAGVGFECGARRAG
jgi:hypothetical protein